jgi:uncharacterized membrane protein
MKMKYNHFEALFMAGGCVAAVVWIAKALSLFNGATRDFLSGFGASLLIFGAAAQVVIRLSPRAKKRFEMDVERKDERSRQISERAGRAAFQATNFALVALMLAFLALEDNRAAALIFAPLLIGTAVKLIAAARLRRTM